MTVKWIVEEFHPDNSFQKLADEVRRQGMVCEVLKYWPFESGSYDIYSDADCVLFQGSINLGLQLQREKSWRPGLWFNQQNFECSTYYAYWGGYLLNRDYIMVPAGDLVRKSPWLFNVFGQRLFIRPNSGVKTFAGRVFQHTSLKVEWPEQFVDVSLEDLVVVSEAKRVDQEWRFVIARGEVVTGCQYKHNGKFEQKPGFPDEAAGLAGEIAQSGFQPGPMYVLDICRVSDKYYLMETNSFSCSGLYECDMEMIVKAATQLAIEEWKNGE